LNLLGQEAKRQEEIRAAEALRREEERKADERRGKESGPKGISDPHAMSTVELRQEMRRMRAQVSLCCI